MTACAVWLQEAVQAVKYYSEKRAEWDAAIEAARGLLQQYTQQRDAVQHQAEQVCPPPSFRTPNLPVSPSVLPPVTLTQLWAASVFVPDDIALASL